MTNNEIKKRAFALLKENPETLVSISLSMLSVYAIIILIESFIFLSARLLGFDYHIFSLSYYSGSWIRCGFLALRLIFYYIMIFSQTYSFRRYLICVTEGKPSVVNYISGHKRKILLPVIKNMLALAGLKILVISPVSVGIYGIVHYYREGMVGEISLPGLVIFMLSIGFTLVWSGVCAHYFLSLSLVKYICEIDPRANFFDACDLSVKLMDGKHQRVFSLYLSTVPIMLFAALLYPLVVLYPFMLESRLILAKEIMGVYWQDKLPGMAKRWEKQQQRLMME
ncbi:MAG: hypothetical protein ACI4JW_05950 [Oscillospiraceae bacterium]